MRFAGYCYFLGLITDIREYESRIGRYVGKCVISVNVCNTSVAGSFHLYGHVHNSFEWNMMEHDKYLMEELYTTPCQMFNVGAMMPWMDYTPRTLDEIIAANSHNEAVRNK